MTGPPSVSPHVDVLLGAYVLGALAPAEEARVAGHLAHCGTCRITYLDMADAQALLATLSEDDLLDLLGGPGGSGRPGGGTTP
ncbi:MULTISPECIES: zf-HC2 domain-containing protein [Streptomyces]|uniref:Zf-HC2 domain-containing protein n=1 Tax=Streptomyces pratisoli TaxID=3139917 RepID=A0ACC6QSI0_9ACTN|nr:MULTISPECIES: zf-HC2 domain-containing protein [unclassified Streptomyces]MCX4514120.1 zf-HC2 domain-containing protein [Streptomyces sp. NBC_01619]